MTAKFRILIVDDEPDIRAEMTERTTLGMTQGDSEAMA